jgi:heme-NO-binding protein
MYGMVNLAIKEFLCGRYGPDIWAAIRLKISMDFDQFLTMEQYPDQLSVDILVAASDLVDEPASRLLEQLGEYWIAFAERSGYGELLEVLGNDLFEALQNLDNLHTRVGFAFPDLLPPSFWVTDIHGESLVLHYQSARVGLAPMVIGLLKGLGRRFSQKVRVGQIDSPSSDHHRFQVDLV